LPSYDVSKPKVLGKIHRMPVMSDNTRNYTLHRENEKYPYDEGTRSALFGTHGKTVFGTKGKIDGKRMIRLLLVDDQSIVRQGLRMRLSMEPDIVVVGEASNGEQAIELVHALSPDIVLMDVEMPGMDGISATAGLHATPTQSAVVMMSIHDDAQTRARAQAAGAAAFITKSGIFEDLLTTVRHIVDINGRV
jgi:CheY-like chemotaxis protein